MGWEKKDLKNGPTDMWNHSVFKTISVESPTYPSWSDGTRRKTSSIRYDNLNIVDKGGACPNDDFYFCKIGLLCSPDKVCVGPAKTGENCTASASGYMCVDGNWCNCTGDYSVCSCVKEGGNVCSHDYECSGGHGCDGGKCVEWFSLSTGKTTSSSDYCHQSLGYHDGKCTEYKNIPCTVSRDCQGGTWYGIHDPIFYPCTAGYCEYTGSQYCYQLAAEVSGALTKYNNNYDKKYVPDLPVSTFEEYAFCMYWDHLAKGAHASKPEILVQVESLYCYLESTWVDVGGACNEESLRCKVGSYCANNTCMLYKRENEPCGLDNGEDYDTGPYSTCDAFGLLACDKVYYDGTPTYVGPVGKCKRGTKKIGAECGYYFQHDDKYDVGVLTTKACDTTNGVWCDIYNYYTEAVNYTGTCRHLGTAPSGTPAQWQAYCENTLVYNQFDNGDRVCRSWEDANISCSTWQDCSDFRSWDYFGVYEVHYSFSPFYYGWNYDEIMASQAKCVDGKCMFNGPTDCNDKYREAVNYNLANLYDPDMCPYRKCQLKEMVTLDYTVCSTNDSFKYAHYQLFIITLISILYFI